MMICEACPSPITAQRRTKRYCSTTCAMRKYRRPPGERPCRVCTKMFQPVGHEGNKRHCSEECSRESARRARVAFKKRRPELITAHRATQRAKNVRDTAIERLWRKYPELPHGCEGCGESRALDIAHRPEHRRNGAWRTMKNTTPEKVWILCPTCHALLDRLGYTAEQLGIKPRVAVAA